MAQYFKSNMFSGFCKQVCQLFSSVSMFYPDVIIKVSLSHIEVSHLNAFRLAKSNNSSDSKRFNQTNYLTPSLAAMISASVVERAVVFYS
jgi:hypothetical protein